MKLSMQLLTIGCTLLIVALQNCSLTGNNASKTLPQPLVQIDSVNYISDIQADSNFRMVSLTNYLQPLLKDIRYETQQNFTKTKLYNHPQLFLRLPAAKALQDIQSELKSKNLSLKIFDAYRPYSVTVEMWKIVPDERYAANPAKGSGHNRGIAVDVSLVDLTTGKELKMPTDFDDFTEKAHHNYMQLDSSLIANRNILRTIMEKHGFVALETEWWHYSLSGGKKFPLLDFSFDQLKRFEKQFN